MIVLVAAQIAWDWVHSLGTWEWVSHAKRRHLPVLGFKFSLVVAKKQPSVCCGRVGSAGAEAGGWMVINRWQRGNPVGLNFGYCDTCSKFDGMALGTIGQSDAKHPTPHGQPALNLPATLCAFVPCKNNANQTLRGQADQDLDRADRTLHRHTRRAPAQVRTSSWRVAAENLMHELACWKDKA